MSYQNEHAHDRVQPPVLDPAQLEQVQGILAQIDAERTGQDGTPRYAPDVLGMTPSGTFVSVERALGPNPGDPKSLLSRQGPDGTPADYFVVRWGTDLTQGTAGLKQVKLPSASRSVMWSRNGGALLSDHPDLPGGEGDMVGGIGVPDPYKRAKGKFGSIMTEEGDAEVIFPFGADGQPQQEHAEPLHPANAAQLQKVGMAVMDAQAQ